MSTKLMKSIKAALVNPLTIIIIQSLKTGISPDKLKIARVIPLFRKDDETIFSNYRPISLLPAISNVFEKTIFIQTYKYFQSNHLWYENQYGFREGHSIELAALEFVDRIIQEMDQGETPFNVYLDLSKAFDMLDHAILLHKLDYYGIKDNELKLFNRYLTNHKQFVDIEGIKSVML